MTTLPDFKKIKSILFHRNGIKIKRTDQPFKLPICSEEKYYAVRTSLGYLLNITHYTVKNSKIKSKCPSSCLWYSNSTECNGHQLNDFIEGFEYHIKALNDNTIFRELVPLNFVCYVRKRRHVNIYFISNSNITNDAYGSIEFFKEFSFKIFVLFYTRLPSGCAVFCHYYFIKTYLMTRLLRCVSNIFFEYMCIDNDLTPLANLIEMLWYTHRPADKMPDDMEDFVDKCKSDSKLLASELLKHRFFQGEKKILNNDIKSRLNIDFQIVKELGKGAFGKVIMARHRLDNQLYAIKRVPIKSEKEVNEKTKEIDLLARLTHENVVRYYNSWIEEATQDDFNDESSSDVTGSDETDSSIRNKINNSLKSGSVLNKVMCIQMEFCEKSTLRLAIDNDLSIDRKRRLLLFNGIHNGLSYIHSQNIIHRDLNPRNIFINSNDQIKIGDFGQATTPFLALKSKFTNKTDPYTVGTFLYVAPELMENTFSKAYNIFVDLYSLGIIYFEMCNPPFKTEMERYEKIKALQDGELNLRESVICEYEYNLIKALVEKDVSIRIDSWNCLKIQKPHLFKIK